VKLFKLNFRTLKILRGKAYRLPFVVAIVTVIGGTIFYHLVEGWDWLDSMYFSVITLTTVGYGDFSPQTDLGKIFTMFYVLTGVGVMFGLINAFYRNRVLVYAKVEEKEDKEASK
jgi:voltage-gated potassium channel Kch